MAMGTLQAQTNTFPTTGSVGIGTASPSSASLLDVYGPGQVATFGESLLTNQYIDIRSDTGGGYFGLDTSLNGGSGGYTVLAGTNKTLNFAAGTDTWGATPQVTLTPLGYLGIGTGTSGPRTNLDLIGSNATFDIDNSTGNVGTVGVRLLHVDGGTNQEKVAIFSEAVGQWGRGNLIFALNGLNDLSNVSAANAVMTLTDNGNVGIGASSPVAALHVVGAPAAFPATSGYAQAGGITRLQNSGSSLVLDFGGNSSNGSWLQSTNSANLGDSYPLLLNPNGGRVGIGMLSPGKQLDVSGTIRTSPNPTTGDPGGVVFPDSTTQTTAWTGVLCGGDYAEAVNAKGLLKTYEPGDVLVIGDDADGEVQKSVEPYSTMVAGIYATKPGVIGRRQTLRKEDEELPMAMIGIVPTKVTTENGPIHRGDLLVTSSAIGYAMKGTDRSRMLGAVIGKAMGPLESGSGVVEVLVTLQ